MSSIAPPTCADNSNGMTDPNEGLDPVTAAADEQRIVDFIRRIPRASFAELERELESKMPTRGKVGLMIHGNVVLWNDMSERFASAIRRLVEQKRIVATPTRPLVYMLDGCTLTFPIAKRIPKQGYSAPHWLPCVFSVPSQTSPE